MRTNHTVPLAAAFHSHAEALERRHEGASPSLSDGARPPVISTGGASLDFFRCRDTFGCGWVGQDPFSHNLRPEAGEFDPREIVYDLMCPRCKSSVVYAPLCCDCNAAASDLGSERCGACDARAEREEHEAHMLAADARRHEEDRRGLISILTGRL